MKHAGGGFEQSYNGYTSRLVTFVNGITLPLRSTLITTVSSLLRAAPPLTPASVSFLMVFAIRHFPSHPK